MVIIPNLVLNCRFYNINNRWIDPLSRKTSQTAEVESSQAIITMISFLLKESSDGFDLFLCSKRIHIVTDVVS